MKEDIKMDKRLKEQIEFIIETDKLKTILRQNLIINTKRNENDAEHSWHLAMMVPLLWEYAADKNMDMLKVIKMCLLHDIVEIDAGDTFCYDKQGNNDKAEREMAAAERIFGLLPKDQGEEFFMLWREFEELKTAEACFAACLDRLQPLILNYHTEGHTWQKPGITSEMVFERDALLKEHAPQLWELARRMIEDSIEKGYLKR